MLWQNKAGVFGDTTQAVASSSIHKIGQLDQTEVLALQL